MALTRLPIIASVFKDTTPLSAKGYFTSVDKMRPVGAAPDKRVMASFGGWQKAYATALNGKARGSITYKDGSSITTHAIGTHLQIYGWQDAIVQDITPFTSYTTLSNFISTTAGSRTLGFTWASHGLSVNDRFQIRSNVSVGGFIISAGANLAVATVVASNSFTCTYTVSATLTQTSAGGSVNLGVFLVGGREYSVAGPGWGVGSWGSGTWGGSDTSNFEARSFTMSRYGVKNLMVNPSGSGLFEWQSIFTTPSELVTAAWGVSGAGWSSPGVTSLVASASSASDATNAVTLVEGAYHRLEFDVTVVAGSFITKVGTVSVGSSVSTSGHVVTEFFKTTGSLTFSKSATFSGTITNISVKQMERLAIIPNAPTVNNVMCVTDQNIVMVGGTNDYSTGVYSPMTLRWSDQLENPNITVPANQVWTAASTNQAGDAILQIGGRIVGIKQARGEVLIWTDAALYRAVYVADPRIVYSVTLVAQGCGLMSSRSFGTLGGVEYWVSTSGTVFAYSGGSPQAVDMTVREDAFDNIAFIQQALVHMIVCAAENCLQVYYPDKRDGTEVSRYIGLTGYGESFNGTFTRTTGQDASITQYPWSVTATGYIYWDEIGQSGDNSTIGEAFSTGVISIGDGETLAQVDRFIADFANFVGGFQLTVRSYKWPSSTDYTTFGPFNITPATPKNDIGFIVGRYISFHGTGVSYPSNIRFGSPLVSVTDTGMVN